MDDYNVNVLRTVDCLINGKEIKTFKIIASVQQVTPEWADPRTFKDERIKIVTPIDPTEGIVSADSPLGKLLIRAKIGDTIRLKKITYQVTDKQRQFKHPAEQMQPKGWNIKGNVSYRTGEKIYHIPGQEYYNQIKINAQYGGRWFRTEEDAINAGFRRSKI